MQLKRLVALSIWFGVNTVNLFALPTLKIGNGGEPNTLDPQKAIGVPEFHIIDSLFEGLVEKNPKSLHPIPAVAESWFVSPDGKVYTFHLRKNARWTNGVPVTAQDFIFAWTRLITPDVGSHYAQFGFLLKNGKKFYDHQVPGSQLGLVATDPHTFIVTLEQPVSYFLSLLSHSSFRPVPEGVVKKWGDQWTKPENIVTNGPFKLERWHLHDAVQLIKNPSYWDAENVALSSVQFFPLEKMETEENLFRAKQLHLTNSVPPEKIPSWEKEGKGILQKHTFLGSYFYNLNVRNKVLKDVRVRKALALAMDRTEITQHVLKGEQAPAVSFTPVGTANYNPPVVLPTRSQKLNEAKRLLAQAGYPNGKGFPKLELLYNTNEGHKKIAEALQYMWKKNLNVTVTLHNEEWKTYLDSKKLAKYQICRESWIGDYNDPTTFLDFFRSNSHLNTTGWSHPDYDYFRHRRETKKAKHSRKMA